MPSQYAGSSASMPTVYRYLGIDSLGNVDQVQNATYAGCFTDPADAFTYLNSRQPVTVTGVFTGSPFYTFNSPAQGLLASGLTPAWPSGASDFDTMERVGGYIDVPNCSVGDRLVLAAFASTVGTGGYTSLYAIDNKLGTPVPSRVAGTMLIAPNANNNSGGISIGVPVRWSGIWTVASAGTTRVTVAMADHTGTNAQGTVITNMVLRATRYPVL